MEQPIRRVFLIHGWEGNPNNHWFPWLSRELGEYGLSVFAPAMPNTANPKVAEWLAHLQKVVVHPDENTYFVGHSVGCQAILRFLEKFPAGVRAGGAVFVGGFFILTGLETEEDKKIARPWISTPIDCAKVTEHARSLIAIFSDDDPYVPLDNQDDLRDKLGSEIIIKQKMGHFSGSNGITELPIVLESILKISK